MPVLTDHPAPYAPASAVLELIERHRNKGLPQVVDADVLVRAGISDSLVPRTLQALRILDLLTNDGKPSEIFERIRLAPTAEYQQRLAEWLSAAYADALTYVDPATDDEVAIRDAFRKYAPTGQQARMVSLFIGLFTAAGVIPTQQKQVASKKASGPVAAHKASKSRSQTASPVVRHEPRPREGSHIQIGGLPPAVAGLMATLPDAGDSWTQLRRNQFVATLSAVLDYTYKIADPENAPIETATDQ